jgi:dipeptidase E
MSKETKLFLYSLNLTKQQYDALVKLTGKPVNEIRIGLIENATDIIPGSDSWLEGIRKSLTDQGFSLEVIDLRLWTDGHDGLYDILMDKDVIWVGGGHTYYLRWILRASGADRIITDLVDQGKVYAGWSAGAVVAGPSIRFFDAMGDDPKDAPELIEEGLSLCPLVIVPHIDHPDFMEGAKKTSQKLQEAGFEVCELKDDQAFVVQNQLQKII